MKSFSKTTVYALVLVGVIVMAVAVSLLFTSEEKQENITEEIVQDSIPEAGPYEIDENTGLIQDEGINMVIGNCTGCHSAKLITQYGATREGWVHVIRWMQDSQNLWDLGENEETILDYLSKNYAPKTKGRRAPLTDIEWYDLKQ